MRKCLCKVDYLLQDCAVGTHNMHKELSDTMQAEYQGAYGGKEGRKSRGRNLVILEVGG